MITQMKFLGLDLKRWKCPTYKDVFYTVFEQAVWATVLYRLSRALYFINVPVIRILARMLGFFIFKFSEICLGVSIPPGVSIGQGLYIGHAGGIRINYAVIAGKNLSIGPGVIIGSAGLGRHGVPEIGDNVYIGVGAKVLGHIKIGDHVRIGANAVVIGDVPDHATVVGASAKVIERKQWVSGQF